MKVLLVEAGKTVRSTEMKFKGEFTIACRNEEPLVDIFLRN